MSVDARPHALVLRTGATRTLVAAVLALGLGAGLLGAAAQARAAQGQPDDVTAAQDRVDALQGEVARVADQLTEGTRRYTADRARLTKVDRLVTGSRSRISRTQAQADRGTQTVNQIAAQLYRAPQPGLLLLSLSESTADITEILAVQNDLQQVSGRQAGEVRRAVGARVRLQGEQRVLQELRAEAAALTRRSAHERATLVALAEATSVRLDAAQRTLSAARAAREARIVAERAAQAAQAARAAAAVPRSAAAPRMAKAPGAAPPPASVQHVQPAGAPVDRRPARATATSTPPLSARCGALRASSCAATRRRRSTP